MKIAIAISLALLAAQALAGDAQTDCASQRDDKQRLACYDKIIAPTPLITVDAVATQAVETIDTGRASSGMAKAWELGGDDKRGTFVVKT